jgi:capsular exopolysaccharide synthesis family protein
MGHSLPEVQGSSAAAIQLTADQKDLMLAKEDLQRQEAILNSLSRGGAAGSAAALESKSIQALKEHEAQLVEKIALLSSYDPRRISLEQGLGGVRAQIASETNRIVSSIRHNVDVDRANVHNLELAVALDETKSGQVSTAATVLANLKGDAEAKRQMYIAFGSRTEQMRMAASQLPSARILFPAASQPSHSFELMAMLLGFLVGTLGACATYVLRDSLSRVITSTGKMELLTGIPVYGSLPEISRGARGDLLMLAGETKTVSVFAETLRGVWLMLRGVSGGTTVVVTSSEVGEGKTTVSTTLARTIAADGYSVLLIDADLRRPKLAQFLKMPASNSLERVLAGTITLQEAVATDAHRVDCLLTKGNRNPMRVLSSPEFRTLLADARATYDFVVVDSPPVMRVADSVIIAKLCQHILFVVQAGRMTADSVTKAVGRFAEEDRSKILTLLTRVNSRDLDKDDYFGGYESLTLEDH